MLTPLARELVWVGGYPRAIPLLTSNKKSDHEGRFGMLGFLEDKKPKH
jgi:hypothetical protein